MELLILTFQQNEVIFYSLLLSLIISQTYKIIINQQIHNKIVWEIPNIYSLAVALTTALLIKTGFTELFYISLMMTSILIYDLLNKKEINKHSNYLNKLTKTKHFHISETKEVIIGSIIGIISAIIIFIVNYYRP